MSKRIVNATTATNIVTEIEKKVNSAYQDMPFAIERIERGIARMDAVVTEYAPVRTRLEQLAADPANSGDQDIQEAWRKIQVVTADVISMRAEMEAVRVAAVAAQDPS